MNETPSPEDRLRQARGALRDMLTERFSEVSSVRRIIDDAGLEPMVFPALVRDAWHAILTTSQSRTDALVEVVQREAAERDPLRALAEDYRVAMRAAQAAMRGAGGGAVVPPGVSVLPRYPDAETRALGEELEAERRRRAELRTARQSTAKVDARIAEIRKKLRRGGRLAEGYSLGGERYLLLEQVGSGSYGTVWSALDRVRREKVAIKVLLQALSGDIDRHERFFRGARVMAGLDHHAVVRVLDPRCEDDGCCFFVMELSEGGDLRRAVEAGRVKTEQVVPILLEVGGALARAHAGGIIHRDVKPENIVLDATGAPKLTDFDLVRVREGTQVTGTELVGGSHIYMAPEQLHGLKVDAGADVHALGMTALYCFHGQALPITVGRRPEKVIDPLPLNAALKVVLLRSIEPDPGDRYPEAGAFCDALREALRDAVGETRVSPWSRAAGVPVRPAPPKVVVSSKAIVTGEDALGRFLSFVVAGVVQRMRWIPPGRFTMGSPESERGRVEDEVQHEVELTQGYWMADTPCTQALWEVVMGENPSRFRAPKRPVEQVSWEDSQVFLRELNKRVEGLDARLPTEAEWEYACRGGTKTATWLGDLDGDREAIKAPILDAIAWYGENAGYESKPVGLKRANPSGLHDMLGNVFEWCEDRYARPDRKATADPAAPKAGSRRVIRGGSWDSGAWSVRAAYRLAVDSGDRYGFVGFRLARGQGPAPGGRSPR